ncbi:MAG: hypothetical protein PWR29_331 [Methanolobus sp.]|jgi:hypothetical protein|nr:hypothetical protein [Methanolobus sp.]
METEDMVIYAIALGALVSFVIYLSTSPLPCSHNMVETVTIGGIFAYMFSHAGLL